MRRNMGCFEAVAIPSLIWNAMAFICDAQVQNRHGPLGARSAAASGHQPGDISCLITGNGSAIFAQYP
jgi:hypothetical protein